MKALKPISLLCLTIMLVSFASCELIGDMLPIPGTEAAEPAPEKPAPMELLVTDSLTTNLTWQLQEVYLDGTDFTAAYDQVYQLESSYFDMRSNGTFSGALLNETYADAAEPLSWQVKDNTLTLSHDYTVKGLSSTQLVLERTMAADKGWNGEVVTYVFVKE